MRTLLSVLLCAVACKSSTRPPVVPHVEDLRVPASEVADADVSAAVLREIEGDPAIKATGLRVTTREGIVEITGSAANVLAKDLATRHAEVVRGVRAVINRMSVAVATISDDELVRCVTEALRSERALHIEGLAVTAKEGVVSLAGTAPSFPQKMLAERLAKRTHGVRDVSDGIEIEWKADRTDLEIAGDVERRLRWDVLVDDGLVHVDVRDGKVKLFGVVGSAAEKSHAQADAWVVGVREVDVSDLDVKDWARDGHLRTEETSVPSDAEIADALRDVLAYDPRVSAASVRATVAGGTVTLEGTVATPAERATAEQVARHTVGVHHVTNRIDVAPQTPADDRALEGRVRRALELHPYTDHYEIRVSARAGTVTLTGLVDSAFEKVEAETTTSAIPGVAGVENRLVVRDPSKPFVYDPYLHPFPPLATWYVTPPAPAKSDDEIAEDIRAELFWTPYVSDVEIAVEVRDGIARLSGAVTSARQKTVATEKAMEGGAIGVENELVVR